MYTPTDIDTALDLARGYIKKLHTEYPGIDWFLTSFSENDDSDLDPMNAVQLDVVGRSTQEMIHLGITFGKPPENGVSITRRIGALVIEAYRITQ